MPTHLALITLLYLWNSAARSVDLELGIIIQTPAALSITLLTQLSFDQAAVSLTSMLPNLVAFLLLMLRLLPWLHFPFHSWSYISILTFQFLIPSGLAP